MALKDVKLKVISLAGITGNFMRLGRFFHGVIRSFCGRIKKAAFLYKKCPAPTLEVSAGLYVLTACELLRQDTTTAAAMILVARLLAAATLAAHGIPLYETIHLVGNAHRLARGEDAGHDMAVAIVPGRRANGHDLDLGLGLVHQFQTSVPAAPKDNRHSVLL